MNNRCKSAMVSRKAERLKSRIGNRALVLVGLMGSGKSTIGKRMAKMLDLRFCDSDHEIEAASQMTIPELFAVYGEQEFRDLERRVIFRLLQEGPVVLATGGGAFMNSETRAAIRKRGVSVWLRADIDLLMERVCHKNNRPLLRADNPRDVMKRLMGERHPVYAEADVTVQSRKVRQDVIIRDIIRAIGRHLAAQEETVIHEQ